MAQEKENIEITLGGLEKLLSKTLSNIQEERDLALERYRRQDEMILTAEDFVLQGKNNSDYLKTAAERTNAILIVAKFIKDITVKDDAGKTPGSGGLSDDVKRELEKMMDSTK